MSSNEQCPAQQPQPSQAQQQTPEPQDDFARKGVLAAIGGAASGTRALWTHFLGGDS